MASFPLDVLVAGALFQIRSVSNPCIAAPSGPRLIQVAVRARDVEQIEIAAAEATAMVLVARNGMSLEHGTVRSKDVDQRSRSALPPSGTGDDIAFAIEAHAFDAAVRALSIRPKCV